MRRVMSVADGVVVVVVVVLLLMVECCFAMATRRGGNANAPMRYLYMYQVTSFDSDSREMSFCSSMKMPDFEIASRCSKAVVCRCHHGNALVVSNSTASNHCITIKLNDNVCYQSIHVASRGVAGSLHRDFLCLDIQFAPFHIIIIKSAMASSSSSFKDNASRNIRRRQ